MFCNELYVNSLKEIWKLKDIENKSTNATLSMYDFCNQFVDVCLVSTDTVDPDQLGIMSLLDHLSIFDHSVSCSGVLSCVHVCGERVCICVCDCMHVCMCVSVFVLACVCGCVSVCVVCLCLCLCLCLYLCMCL